MSEKKKLLFISAFIPFGRRESFVLQEACLVKELYKDFLIIPRNPPKEIFHQKSHDLVKDTIWLPLFDGKMAMYFMVALFFLKTWRVMGSIVRHSRNFKMGLKNFLVLPKAVYVVHLLKRHNVGHIHAHWGSTTATMAYIIHGLSGTPFSFTLHRWDIYENNMLREKVRTACFARCISKKGREDVLSMIGQEFKDKVNVLHMGVEIPDTAFWGQRPGPFVMMTPANLLPVKGHRYLIDACQRLKTKGIDFKYWIVGDGPLDNQLKQMVQDQGLAGYVSFLGRLPHEKIIQMYKDKSINAVILPSVNSEQGEMEGIPVALMEAMSYGVPVISTNTGAIPELLGDGCGIMVDEKNDIQLAGAVEQLINNKESCLHLSSKGRERIKNEFDLLQVAGALINLTGLQK